MGSHGTGKCIFAVLAGQVLAAAPVVFYPVQFAVTYDGEGIFVLRPLQSLAGESAHFCDLPELRASRLNNSHHLADTLDRILVWVFGEDWDCQFGIVDRNLCQCQCPVLKQSVSG